MFDAATPGASWQADCAATLAAQSAVIAAARELMNTTVASGGDSAFTLVATGKLRAALAALGRPRRAGPGDRPMTAPAPMRVFREMPDPLRSHADWRAYLAATIRLRRATPYRDRLVPRLKAALFDRPVMLEGRIMRATGLTMGVIFRAAEVDADAIARRYGRWLP